MRHSKTLRISALLSLLAALVLELLPYGAVLVFAPGPGEKLVRTYSYFSMTPFGYANFFPLPAGILTASAMALCVVCLIRRNAAKGEKAALICAALSAVLSAMPLLLGFQYMNAAGGAITALLLLAACLLAAGIRAKRKEAE